MPDFTLVTGLKYVRRDGVIIGPLIRRGTTFFPFMDPKDKCLYTEDGKFFGNGRISQLDLIHEYTPGVPLEKSGNPLWG